MLRFGTCSDELHMKLSEFSWNIFKPYRGSAEGHYAKMWAMQSNGFLPNV